MKKLAIRVEVGASDATFTPAEVSGIVAALYQSHRRETAIRREAIERIAIGLDMPLEVLRPPGGDVSPEDDPLCRLASLLRDEVQALPVPEGCTGRYDTVRDNALVRIVHETVCSVHNGE
jgi:hypothetical protein